LKIANEWNLGLLDDTVIDRRCAV